MSQPQTLTLNQINSIEYIEKFVSVSHSKGIFKKEESHLIKRSFDVLVHKFEDKDITTEGAIKILENAFDRGQSMGHFTIQDASLAYCAFTVLSRVASQALKVQEPAPEVSASQAPQVQEPAHVHEISASDTLNPVPKMDITAIDDSDDEFDLSELAKPIPLKPVEI